MSVTRLQTTYICKMKTCVEIVNIMIIIVSNLQINVMIIYLLKKKINKQTNYFISLL